jgi:ElaB/YqjD/DUF883 family membrane-anchored ribosome-binding protein
MDTIRKMTETITKDRDKALERVREVADTAWDKGHETWKELRGQGQEVIDQAQKSAEELWDDTEKLVQKHPGKAVGIALLVGAALGSLLALRHND